MFVRIKDELRRVRVPRAQKSKNNKSKTEKKKKLATKYCERYIKAIFSSCFIPCSNGVLYLNVSTIKLTYLFQMISLGSHLPSNVHSCLYLSPENDQSRLMSTCLDSSNRDAFLLTSFSFFMGRLLT